MEFDKTHKDVKVGDILSKTFETKVSSENMNWEKGMENHETNRTKIRVTD